MNRSKYISLNINLLKFLYNPWITEDHRDFYYKLQINYFLKLIISTVLGW